ncbi:MAG: methylated-DNA--[protein]-cysteine S-methyltransferase [Phaeodactylibacter sp.]|nr:methylated-DNA--[protein]-cysteine S-methyltransferase [Phaeodactylibacter sp.]
MKTYYQALVQRDESYLGVFFVGVKTTSIFCLPTCRARKPKPENVEFFSELKDALDYGYRPCKICRPTENAHAAPPYVEQAIQWVKAHPKTKITDEQLAEQGISPEQLRRWFKQHYGITFQAYQRMYRINSALEELKKGSSATNAAFSSGYESLSGFGYTFRKLTGRSPAQGMELPLILLDRITTPLGPMFVAATDKGLCMLEFTDRRMLETEFRDLQRLLKRQILRGENEHVRLAKEEVQAYFEGELQTFTVPIDAPGTSFQQSVWTALRAIPYGTTTSYQALAAQLPNANAVRAVASANGANRISIILPCHRIIGKDGQLRGYGGGLERKRWLLDFERTQLASGSAGS